MANLQKRQNRAARIITRCLCDLLAELGWLNLEAMRQRQKAILIFKVLNGLTPRICLKCLQIRPLFRIMDCDLPK